MNVKKSRGASTVRSTNVKHEDTTFSSKTRDDLSEAVTLPINRPKVVSINPKPTMEEVRKECSRSVSPIIPSNIPVQKYEWTSYFFPKPAKSAMKRKKNQLPKDSIVLSHAPISPDSGRMFPATSPTMKKPVNLINTFPLIPSNAVSSTQSSIKDAFATSATSETPLSSSILPSTLSKDIYSTSKLLPTLPRDSTVLPPILRPSVVSPISPMGSPNATALLLKSPKSTNKLSLKDSTLLPAIPEKGIGGPKVLSDHEKSSSVMLRKTSMSASLTEPKKLPPIKMPPRSSQKQLKKSSTCSTMIPLIPPGSSKGEPNKQKGSSAVPQAKGCSGSVKLKNPAKMLPICFSTKPQECSKEEPPKDSGTALQNKSSKKLAMSSKDYSKVPLKTPKRMLQLASPIKPPLSPEKPRKVITRKETNEPLNIAKGNPEKVSIKQKILHMKYF